MDMNLTQPLVLLVAGAAAFGWPPCWALRISDGARGAAKEISRGRTEGARETGARRKRVRRSPRRHHGVGRCRARRHARQSRFRMGPAQSLWLARRSHGDAALRRRWHLRRSRRAHPRRPCRSRSARWLRPGCDPARTPEAVAPGRLAFLAYHHRTVRPLP